MNKLKDKLNNIIKKKSNFLKLTYEIDITIENPINTYQFPNQDFSLKKISIVCKKTNINSFFKLNNEIKELCNEIQKIDNTYLVNFIFEKCSIKFFNENINLDCHISFNNCNINVNVQDVNLDEIYLLSKNFQNCKFENLSVLCNIKILHINLNSNSINLLQLVKLEMIDNGINKIKIKNSEIINKIVIKESIFKRDFIIYNSEINSIEIENVDFESLSEFNEVNFQENFNLKRVNYKNYTLFDKCVFNTKAKFKYIIFEKPASFRGTIFNKGLNLDFISSDKEINFYDIKGLENNNDTSQETYRMIKYNFEKIGNKIEANKYHALELNQKKINLESDDNRDWKELWIFKFQDWSSKHSTDWFRALVWIFIVGLITTLLNHSYFHLIVLFSIVLVALKTENLFITQFLIILYSILIILVTNIYFIEIFKYINIILKASDFKYDYFLMSLNKVSLGYLYYQFLMSVRKDTRK